MNGAASKGVAVHQDVLEVFVVVFEGAADEPFTLLIFDDKKLVKNPGPSGPVLIHRNVDLGCLAPVHIYYPSAQVVVARHLDLPDTGVEIQELKLAAVFLFDVSA